MRLLAGIITISPGHDASYPWRQIGTSPEDDGAGRRGAEYYLSPAGKGGEPPGIWRGDGPADLGLREGEVIDRGVFERLYGGFIDPRDPGGRERLGRAPQRFRPAEEIFAELAALEPEATAERRAELMIEAKVQVRMPVQYFDVTFSVSKSITLLHAPALANAARAAATGDPDGAAYWEQAARDVWACVQAGNQAALEYLQREAGYTRAGYHGRDVSGARVGRWEDAHAFIVGSFAQHTSRDGDPQLHIHNLVLNRVMRESDGAWRTLDSRALHEHRGAAAAIATLVMESALSRELGVGWVRRADGHGREVACVSRALMEEFSSRRESICALTGRLAGEFEEQRGFAPDARALGKLRQWVNHASRDPKPAAPLDLGAEVRRWAAQARASEAGTLEPLLPAVSARRGIGAAPGAGALLSASETLRAELSAADHLGVLGSIWYDQARCAQAARFTGLLRGLLTPADAEVTLADPACTWLWRSLREAEAAGRDAGEVLGSAVAARSLHDARDIARVLDSRVRRMLADAVPQRRGAWSERVPEMGDLELDRFMAELAAAMDDRTRRIGEHAARTAPRWATRALGDVPADPVLRLGWEQRAAALGAYRTRSGRSRARPPRTPGPTGAPRSRRSARSTASTCAGTPTGSSSCSGPPTSRKRAGRHPTWPRNCGWPGCKRAPRSRTR